MATQTDETEELAIQAPKNRAAYERVLPLLAQVKELQRVNVDAVQASLTVLRALPALQRLRSELASLPGFQLALFDQLEDLARAVRHACTLVELVRRPRRRSLRHIAQELVDVRSVFLAEAKALVARGVLDRARLRRLQGVRSHRGLAADVLALVESLREQAATGQSRVTRAELDAAAALAEELESGLAARAIPVPRAEARLNRQRAFTLMYEVYEKTRRGILYLRWEHGDAEQIAESLHRGHGGRGSESHPAALNDAVEHALLS